MAIAKIEVNLNGDVFSFVMSRPCYSYSKDRMDEFVFYNMRRNELCTITISHVYLEPVILKTPGHLKYIGKL